jgi:RNA polymerase sigma factor (sigma-70 family)
VAVDVTTALPGGDPGRFLRNEPDEALVAHVLQGSEAAFEVIYDRHHRGLIAFCRHMLRNREEAEDALQHTFAAAYRSLTSGDRPNALKPWLYTIARNRCLTVMRARRTRDEAAAAETPVDETVVEGLSDAVQRRTDLQDLVADLHRLPEDQRAAIVLFEMGDQSHAEIAEVLDVNREKVKALVFQAREGLMRARTARDTPCAEIRQHLSSRTRALPRRGVIRGHLENCPACAAYDLEVRRQRASLAMALPVMPSLELKGSVLGPLLGGGATVAAGSAAVIGTGAAGTLAGGGAMGAGAGAAGVSAAAVATGAGGGLTGGAAMSGLGALAANAVVAKVVTVVAVAGAAAGAGHAIHERHAAKPNHAAPAKAVVVSRSKPVRPKVVLAPAPPQREAGAESTTVIPHQVTQTQTTVHTTTTTTSSWAATTAAAATPVTSPASTAHQPAADPTAPATGGTAAGGTTGGTSAPASEPASPTDAGASGSASSTTTPPDTTTPPAADTQPVVLADQLPPDAPTAATAVDPVTGEPVTCPPGTGPVSTDPNAAPAPPPVPPSTDPSTAPPVPTVTLPDGTVTPIPAGCELLPAAAGTQDPAISAAVAADTADATPAP